VYYLLNVVCCMKKMAIASVVCGLGQSVVETFYVAMTVKGTGTLSAQKKFLDPFKGELKFDP